MSKPNLVGTLMAGVIGSEHYGLDDKGRVYIFDADGTAHEIKGTLAARVKATIEKGIEGAVPKE